jgi:hypothetical protein
MRTLAHVDRKEAENIVRRDLPGVIKEILKRLPFKPPKGLAEQIYDTAFDAMVADVLDGSIAVTPDGRLTSQLVESSGNLSIKLSDAAGNVTTP